mgnify:FL=1
MMISCFLLLLPMLALGFNPLTDVSMNGIKIRGSTKPLENFDPLDLSLSNTDERILFFREAELKHGRIAMVSSLLIPFLDKMDPNVLGIHGFNHLPDKVQLLIVGHMFIAEFASMFKGWEKPWKKLFTLKSDYQPGDLGFKLSSKSDEEMNILMDKELNNGRLAMIGAFGMIAQQLVTQQHLF